MKYIPYGHHWIDKEDIRAVTKVLESGIIAQGPIIRKFEEKLTSYCGAKYAVCISSGTAALHIACLAAGIKPGDEVITSPITFVASANCVLYCQGNPVFADIEDDTINIDPEQIKKKITRKTKTIIPIHFAGHPCDLKEISRIARDNNLMIIEDATHALGAEYNNSKIGSCKYSDMTVFSFHPVKSITTGEGGAILTNRKDLYEKLLMLRNHGITKERSKFKGKETVPWYYEQQLLGFNYRITDFQCALGISQLKKIDRFIQKRRRIALIYNDAFRPTEETTVPIERKNVKSSYHLYVIRLKSRNLQNNRRRIFNYLKSKKIYTQVHYIPVYWHPYYKNRLGYKRGLCPVAEGYYEEALTLPLFPKMSNKEIEYVKGTVSKALVRYKV